MYSDTIPLNSRGYDDKYLYTEQGLLLKRKSFGNDTVKVDSNNLLYHLSGVPDDKGTIRDMYSYDLTRPAIPPIYQYFGIGNQNLIVSIVTSASNSYYLKTGPVYRIDYFYNFDVNGRVKREIQVDTEYPKSGWFFHVHSGGIGVTDFEYTCQ